MLYILVWKFEYFFQQWKFDGLIQPHKMLFSD